MKRRKQSSPGSDIFHAKSDSRLQRGLWIPGPYLWKCPKCEKWYFGDAKSLSCAECAYKEETNLITTAIYGKRCDAITASGKRCTRKNVWDIQCAAVYEARANSYRVDTLRRVLLCACHMRKSDQNRKIGKRLRLHHGGWFGGFNKRNFGNLVLNKPRIDWTKENKLVVPKFWQKDYEV